MSKRRARGTGRIFQPKNCKFYYIQFWQEGQQIRESSKSTVKQVAESMLRDRLSRADRGHTPVSEQRRVSYADLRQRLFDSYHTKKNKSLQTMADGSETIWGLKPLDDFMGYAPATDDTLEKPGPPALSIDTDRMRRFVRERRAEGVSDATILSSMRLLRRMFHLATEKANASGRSVLDAVPDFELPTKPKPRLDFLREAEMLALLEELPARLHAFIKFLFYQGVRSGEVEAITWAQIDLNRAIFFPDAERNKTGDSRVKALADHTVQALQKITPDDAKDRERFMLENKDEHVFDTTNYKKLFKRACLKLGFAYLGWQCGQCGVTRKVAEKEKQTCKSCHCPMHFGYIGMTTHGFRRSAIVYYRDGGTPDAVIMSLSGHTSLDIYRDYSVSDLQAQREAQRRTAAKSEEHQRNQRITVRRTPLLAGSTG
jgi:integrase